ncbi:hypothetical protein [Halorubrum sp. CSM-61]|uniref:hypothetical protein n=1 Tax=Halorubrum sp. CSM-61 TaxID=2485838 RepID=UPI000F4BC9CE|nr:hypothetical protein [Halorubrum sp. CSM-61]
MAETCPHLAYRTEGDGADSEGTDSEGTDSDGGSFDEPRAFCTVTGSFVQPMRADICNARYGLDPEADCEFYVEAESSSEGGERPDADR